MPDGLFVLVGDPNGLERGNGFGAEVLLIIDQHPKPEPDEMGNPGSWVPDLTTTNPPGLGPAITHRVAVFRAVE